MQETQKFTRTLLSTGPERQSRRSLLRGAVAGAVGVGGLAAIGASFIAASGQPAHAAGVKASNLNCSDTEQDILNIAATAEQLAVVFYTNGILKAGTLGISGQNLNYLTAAVVEEQLHLNLLLQNGAKPLVNVFSFPHGWATFSHQDVFINTLQQLETAFESAYLAAVKEFAEMGQPGLAMLAGQIATIEAEHRALGRSISSSIATADNWAFTPVYVTSVGDAVNVLSKEGYLSPSGKNSFTFIAASTKNPDVTQRTPYSVETC